MTKFSSPVPVGSRLTSNFSKARKLWGIIRAHAGTDWAPPKAGEYVDIYAVADGTVVGAGVGVLAGHSGQIVVIDHGVLSDASGSDRTLTNYGHLSSILVKKGQKVKAGQLIAKMGKTGNVTGVHLHLGVRFNGVYADPKKWLANKGITPGKTAPVSQKDPVVIKPAGNIQSKPIVSKPGYNKSTENVQQALKNMGYKIVVDGFHGPKTTETIKEYQSSQRAPYTLVADGVWGAKTKAHYIWTKALQTAMNGWKGSKLNPDGHYGANTVARIRELQKRNLNKAYKGRVDGIPGRVFCKMLKVDVHP